MLSKSFYMKLMNSDLQGDPSVISVRMADGSGSKKRKLEEETKGDSEEDSMNVILALFGSFNPVTFLHLRTFELARDYLTKRRGWNVIGGVISPVHIAYGKKGLLSNEHRLAMARAATQDSDWIRVDDWECSQEGWTETAKALIEVEKCQIAKHPRDNIKLRFLCGGDLLESFATPGLWSDEDIETILTRFGLVVISRHGSNPEKFVYESDILQKFENQIDIVTEWIPNDVSATKIRRSLKRGESVKYLIPDPVIDYIKKHNLYQED